MADSVRDRMLMPPPLSPGSSNRHEPSSTIHTNIIMSDATSVVTSRASSLKSSAFSEYQVMGQTDRRR
ncbi:uncharacterized protein BDW43DRAFT_163597 [Aspergillus alliaceus]|uniref:uncharacterized protein n=1 Tax=Petromyces alliaceus TaxID=209559 RepID=UPI0012A743EE|nr:uncharacterized protein BDW43DRAFT_163597 [Aspergillus alliaceus]KAB8230453.1 hypothetical protein BDW43DRAFT_163597 [Aspergillus alliaceus]